MSRGYQRRNFFINQELQGRLILAVFLLSLVAVALFTTIFAFLSADQLTISISQRDFSVGSTPLVLFKQLLQANGLFILIGGGLLAILTLFVSHCFAGPLYRFERVFSGFNDRDLDQRITLRDKDIGKDLAVQINRFAETYSADLQLLSEHCDLLEKALTTGEQSVEPAEAAQALQQMRQLLGTYTLKSEDEG